MGKQPGDIQELESLLRQINSRINIYTRRYLAERGLTMARFWVMNKLSPDKPLTMGDLQKELCLSPGTLTGLVDGLVEGNNIRRWRDHNDRRLVYLILTPQGKELLEGVIDYRASILQSLLKDQSKTELKLLNHYLQKILDRLKDFLD